MWKERETRNHESLNLGRNNPESKLLFEFTYDKDDNIKSIKYFDDRKNEYIINEFEYDNRKNPFFYLNDLDQYFTYFYDEDLFPFGLNKKWIVYLVSPNNVLFDNSYKYNMWGFPKTRSNDKFETVYEYSN